MTGHRPSSSFIRLLVDGYNVMYAGGWLGDRGRRSLERARAMFLDHLQRRLPGDLAAQTTIVFDAKSRLIGDRPPLSRFRGEVLFASDHDEADDLIEQLIRDHSAPKRLTVVTADRRIQQAARRRRAQVISSEEWLDGLEQEEELD